MDSNEYAGEATIPENSDTGNRNNRSWWDYAAGVSGLVVLFGALIYALGLFVLWIPIWTVHTQDFAVASHATFLVPRVVVAGLGMMQLVAFPLLAGSVTFVIGFYSRRLGGLEAALVPLYIVILVYCVWRIATGPGPLSQLPLFALAVLVAALVALVYCPVWLIYGFIHHGLKGALKPALTGVAAVGMGSFMLFEENAIPPLKNIGVFINSLLNAAVIVQAATIVWVAAATAEVDLESPDPRERRRTLLRELFFVLSFAFIAAFLLTIPSRPPLPLVEIDVKNKDKHAVGTLLTHTDSFWYVFEKEKNQSGSRLAAIPDDEVKTVWVSRDKE
jgi:hypothetical protein